MKTKIMYAAGIVVALALGFTGPTWATPVVQSLSDAARYFLETQMVMILDGQSMRFGCF
jgi:hypothetical protein